MEYNQVIPIQSSIISTGAIKKFIGGILMGCLCSLLVVGNDAHALSESNRGNRLSTDQFVLSSSYQKLRRVLTKNASLGQLPSITKDGYAFLGWYKEKSYTNKVSSTTTIGSDITLYAKLQKCGPYERVEANVASNTGESKCVECAVVLNGNGGTPKCNQAGIYNTMPLSFTGGACGTEANLSSIYEQSHYCTIEAQREGYLFSGWYTAPSGGTSVNKSHMVYGNTYYAQWKPKPIYCTQRWKPDNSHYINTTQVISSPKDCSRVCDEGYANSNNNSCELVCGSAHHGRFGSIPTTDLCLRGSKEYEKLNGSTYNWVCERNDTVRCTATIDPCFNGADNTGKSKCYLKASGSLTLYGMEDDCNLSNNCIAITPSNQRPQNKIANSKDLIEVGCDKEGAMVDVTLSNGYHQGYLCQERTSPTSSNIALTVCFSNGRTFQGVKLCSSTL